MSEGDNDGHGSGRVRVTSFSGAQSKNNRTTIKVANVTAVPCFGWPSFFVFLDGDQGRRKWRCVRETRATMITPHLQFLDCERYGPTD